MKGPSHTTLKSHRNHQKLKMVQIESLRVREKNQKGEGKWRRESKRGVGSGGWKARENGEVPLSYRGEGWEGENEGLLFKDWEKNTYTHKTESPHYT